MEAKWILANLVILLLLLPVPSFSSTELEDSTALLPANDHANLSLSDVEYKCVYTIYVRTSKTIRGGTDSIISLALYEDSGDGVLIKDLEAWGGAMEDGHDYYERGNLDIFTGRGPCLSGPVCAMELTSDGSGAHHGWYCNYVEVTTTGPHIDCAQQLFTVEQWLALDHSPHELTAVRDYCSAAAASRRRRSSLLPVEILLASSA